MTTAKLLEDLQALEAEAANLWEASWVLERAVYKLLEATKRFNEQCERLKEVPCLKKPSA